MSKRRRATSSFSDADLRRFMAWVNYRDNGKWDCPRCGSERHHYIGGHYCSGCHTPLSVACLHAPDAEEQKRADECRQKMEASR